jgi:DNA-binding transcriptional LysR family regulator
MNIELRDVEYFAVVAQHGHIGRAAEALGLSQPAISKSLRRLEALTQAKLVKRTPYGIELTAAGSALLTHVRRLRMSFDDVVREIENLSRGHSGRLRIGAGPDSSHDLLPVACGAFLKSAPNVQIKVILGTFDVLIPSLRNGELDFVIGGVPPSPDEQTIQQVLYEQEFAVFASAHHRLARHRSVTLASLAGEAWVLAASNVISRQQVHRFFEDAGLPTPRVALESDSTPFRLRVVESSDLVGFFWRRLVKQASPQVRLAELRVKEMFWKRRVAVSYRKDAYLTPAALHFINDFKSAAMSSGQSGTR